MAPHVSRMVSPSAMHRSSDALAKQRVHSFQPEEEVAPVSHLSSSASFSCLPQVLDRGLFRRFLEVNRALDQLRALPSTTLSPEDERAESELQNAQREVRQVLQSQKELLEEMDQQERQTFRRYFAFNPDHRVEQLKAKLSEKLTESVRLEAELRRLERACSGSGRRYSVATDQRFLYHRGDRNNNRVDSEDEITWKQATLEREKQDILGELFGTMQIPDARQLHTRIAMHASEVNACESIKHQVNTTMDLYREALHMLRMALAVLVSPEYTSSLKEFVGAPYPLAVDAAHLMEAATHRLQPEARRRYRDFAPEFMKVDLPNFPQVIIDVARRGRTSSLSANSALLLECKRKLPVAENVIMLMQRTVIHKLELLEQWRNAVVRDQEQAITTQRRLETRLHQRMAVLARSATV